MQLLDLTDSQQSAISRALGYWAERWDWECPTLFGLELAELQEIIASWPDSLSSGSNGVALAIQGSLRELLFGASAPPPDSLPRLIGVTQVEAVALLEAIHPSVAVGNST